MDILDEIFDVPKEETSQQEEPVKKVKKSRKPMNETDKQALIERLKAGKLRKAQKRKELAEGVLDTKKAETQSVEKKSTSLSSNNNKEEIKSLREEIKELKALMKEQHELSEKQEIRELIKEKESIKKELSQKKEPPREVNVGGDKRTLPPKEKQPEKKLPTPVKAPLVLKRSTKKWY